MIHGVFVNKPDVVLGISTNIDNKQIKIIANVLKKNFETWRQSSICLLFIINRLV